MNGAWRGFLEQEGARFAASPEAGFDFPDHPAPADSGLATLAALPQLAVIDAYGPDALDFLHAQFCGDLRGLQVGGCQFTAWCNPKGRVITTFYAVRLDDRMRLILPQTVKESVHKRLRLFVLRADVTLDDRSDDLVCVGLNGSGADTVLSAEALAAPAGRKAQAAGEMTAAILPGIIAPRMLLCAPSERMRSCWRALRSRAVTVGTKLWRVDEIRAGIAWLGNATAEQFLPQELNLDETGGLSYTKGCYPGQEIIARVRHRGRLKHRLCRFSVAADAPPVHGTAIVAGETRAATILDAQTIQNGSQIGLAVVDINHLQSPGLRLGIAAGPLCSIDPLPRRITD